MATSGSKSVSVTSWDSLVFSWSVSGQSVANNTSTVTWALKLVSTSSGRIDSSASKDWSVTVNGTKYSGTNTVGIGNNSTKTLASGTTVIKHADDGTKTFSYSFSQEFGITFSGSNIGTISGSGSGTLNTIARASQPSCVTWPEHTQNVGEFGDEISIHMNRKSASFTHTVRYQFGSQSGTIATGVGTGTTWVIPLTLMNLIPSAVKGSGTIYVDTYNGTTKVGTKSCGFTATVPASVKPTCAVSVSDPTGNYTTYGAYVKGLSKFKVVVTPTLAYQSGIKAYSTTANGSKYTAASFTTGVLKTSGTLSVAATVTDNRGRSGSASKSLTVLNYTAPTVSKLTVGRCDSDGTANEQGAYVQATFSASVTSLNSKNTATYKVRYKKTSDSTFTEVTISALANTYAVTNHKYVFAADTGSSYDVEVSVVDNHSTATRTTSASTAFTLMHWKADGTAMAVGKVSEKSNTFEVGLDAEFYGTTVHRGNDFSAYSLGTSGVKGFIALAQIEITHTNANAPITFYLTRRNADSTMTVHVRFQNVSALTPGMDNVFYEGANYGAFMYQLSSSVWVLYVEKTAQNDPIAVQRWTTSPFMDGRIAVTFPDNTQVDTLPTPYYRATPLVAQSIIDCLMPVGFVLTLYSHADPNTMYPGTTWTRITNAFLWACDASGTIGQTGGEKTHTLTTAEMPSHTHGSVYSGNASGTKNLPWLSTSVLGTGDKLAYSTIATGGSEAHNNMPPYIQVSVWRRTA